MRRTSAHVSEQRYSRTYTLAPMEMWSVMREWLSLPQYGLSTVFLIAMLSATLLPLGSEPAVFGLIQLNPEMFWPAIGVASLGNTLGGGISWWMGFGAHKAVDRARGDNTDGRAVAWLRRFGPKACLMSWLPVVGDPLCAVAGWLKLPFWPCLFYMAIGKFLRYLVMTSALVAMMPG